MSLPAYNIRDIDIVATGKILAADPEWNGIFEGEEMSTFQLCQWG